MNCQGTERLGVGCGSWLRCRRTERLGESLLKSIPKSFGEITRRETDELIIPTTGTSFHLLREKDLYLIILSRLPLMPERHLKIARFVLAGLSSRPS